MYTFVGVKSQIKNRKERASGLLEWPLVSCVRLSLYTSQDCASIKKYNSIKSLLYNVYDYIFRLQEQNTNYY